VTYLWWAFDSAIIRRIGSWFERLCTRREPNLYHDWDLELTEAEAERENWETDELWTSTSMAEFRGEFFSRPATSAPTCTPRR
jgi:hypothetical protein